MILVVDDETEIAEELADLLSCHFTDVHFATSASEGLKIALEVEPELVITDMRMPEMHGAELVRRIDTAVDKPTSFIIVSGHLEAEDDLAHLHDIDYKLMSKPIDVDGFIDVVSQYSVAKL